MIKLIKTLLLLTGTFSLAAQPESIGAHGVSAGDSLNLELKQHDLIDSVLNYAVTFIGCRYGYGSCGPQTFDCSGFVMHVFGKYGVELPHGSGTQKATCKEIKLKRVRPGDLLFFSGRKISQKNIGHVAIVQEAEGDKITMIHATVQAGVISEVLQNSEYFNKRFIGAGRLKELE